MRLTRAALRAEATTATTPESETLDASNPQADLKERVPLGEVSANTSPESVAPEEIADKKMPPKKSKAKGGAKKGAKGKKGKATDENGTTDADVNVEVAEVLEDERLAAGSPASDAAVDELANPPQDDIVQIPMADQRPASPPSRAVRMTRRQLAKQEEDLSKSLRSRPLPDHSGAVFMTTPRRKLDTYPDEIILDDDEPTNQEETVAGAQEDILPAQDVQVAVAAPEIQAVEEVQKQESTHASEEQIQAHESEPTPTIQEPTTVPAQEDPTPSLSIEVPSSPTPEPKTLASERPQDTMSQASTPIQSRRQSRTLSRTPSRSPGKSPMRLEASIEAIDALEEALENVGKAIPNFDNNSADEKSPRKAKFDAAARTKDGAAAPKKSPLRLAKNPGGEVKSLKPPSRAPKMTRTSLARSQSTRVAPVTRKTGGGEPTDYLASKRRPISMTFPAPPPPPKSTKQPTKSTFQLPGEAIAAKLKAQKEERLKREEEEGGNARATSAAGKRSSAYLAPGVVKSTKPPTKSNFQLPGEAIAAKLKAQKEERLKREAEEGGRPPSAAFVAPAAPKSTKPLTKSNFQLPGEAVAAKLKAQREERQKREEEKRAQEEAEEKKKVPAAAPTFKARPAPARKPNPTMAVRTTASSRARENLMIPDSSGPLPSYSRSLSRSDSTTANKSSRPSSLMSRTSSTSNSQSNRNSVIMAGGPVVKSTVTAKDAAQQRIKAREIFNRDKIDREERERERREKEEAAKKARAQAAERGRIASREWAEKQKRKLMGGGGTVAANGESSTS